MTQQTPNITVSEPPLLRRKMKPQFLHSSVSDAIYAQVCMQLEVAGQGFYLCITLLYMLRETSSVE